ncbi:hypothetical protein JIQ42_02791 [Leishmania sp. Namibia]|uniref:hypothetical protein n=1 Tax=Leishmania sp. Namibia TaxID=2802991 RepID=UPI001B4D7691|nr:hypothetical protein JIQ42_02791 [Leishmania sp. Namibia]
MKDLLLRVEVSWSIVYLLVLICVAVPIVFVTQVNVARMLVEAWRAVHDSRVQYITKRISMGSTGVHDIANGFTALNIPRRGTYSDRHIMPQLCSSLDHYDKMTRFRALSLVSLKDESVASCIHGVPSLDSARTLTGYLSRERIINGSYIIDNATYDFVQPLQMVTEWPELARNISDTTKATYGGQPIFELLPAYVNGTLQRIDPRHHWVLPVSMPHLLCYVLPLGFLARGRKDISSAHYTDFTQVLLDGSRLLLDYDFVEERGLSMVAFINQSLADNDPLVLSNSWGQPSVSDDSIYSIYPTASVTYLRTSNISDPLMRAALQHVDLASLQQQGYRRTVGFEYAGAAAVVTAYAYTTVQGLVVPVVLASSHAAITVPYMRLMRIFDGIVVAVILLLTLICFDSARRLISQPLRRMTMLMLASLRAGRRALFYTTTTKTLLQLTEMHALIQAHNATMQRLRNVDAFVPEGLVLPLVYVSTPMNIALPPDYIPSISSGVMTASVLLLTLTFWYLIRRTISQPLKGVQTSLLASVEHGDRQLYYPGGCKLVRFTEVGALIQAHNATMQRLRNVDAFVPEGLRHRVMGGTPPHAGGAAAQHSSSRPVSRRHRKPKATPLSSHLSTAACVSLSTPLFTAATGLPSPPLRVTGEPLPRHLPGQQLIAAAEHAAHAANTANSGPFPTRTALTAFITAVQDLCRTYHGTLHRLCPDACVLHFNSAVRAHTPRSGEAETTAGPPVAPTTRHSIPAAQSAPRPQSLTTQEEMQRYAAQDARNAVAFALDLVSWVDAQRGSGESAGSDAASAMPDVRALLDTSMFTCGQYCPAGSEQTLQVALGRDVQRELGRLPQRIGVRVAMTEETATLLRAEVRRMGHGGAKADPGVRQIPVDALRTGRAGLDEGVVVLYEVLPGPVIGHAAWQLYAHCCIEGFAHMLRGDYAGALTAYRGVAEIADLEPGLLPPSMRREAAASAVTGGAVSVQVARLVRECEHRVRLRITEPLCRTRLWPPGVHALLGGTKPVGDGIEAQSSRVPLPAEEDVGALERVRGRGEGGSGPTPISRYRYPDVRERYVVAVADDTSTFRSVVPSAPAWMRDQHGLHWHLARRRGGAEATAESMLQRRVLALGSAGALSSVNYVMYREVHPVVAKAIRDAPPGPMSDALRSATPVCGPSSRQEAALRRLVKKHQQLRHPNLLSLLGFSESLEGGVVLIWEFSPGGTLRELIYRYANMRPVTINRFGLHVLSALSYLHERGVAHGALCLDNVLVSVDGRCRLAGHSSDRKAARELLCMDQACYMSPLMATGALPTPECDMFCFGLAAVEALTKQPAWIWITGDDGQPLGTAAELAVLMKTGGQSFSSALMQGRVVANAGLLRGASVVKNYSSRAVEAVIRCLSLDPAERPTAMQVRAACKEMLLQAGLTLEEDESAASTSDEDG